jgi:hypothetical protein
MAHTRRSSFGSAPGAHGKGLTRQQFTRYYLTLAPPATVHVPRVDRARPGSRDPGERGIRDAHAGAPFVASAVDRLVPRVYGALVPASRD